MRKHKMVRTVITHLLSFFICFCVGGITLLLFIWFGLFNQRVITTGIQSSNYYEHAYEQYQKQVEELVKEIMLPSSVILDVVTPQYFNINSRKLVVNTLNGKDTSAVGSDLRVSIVTSINEYLGEHEIYLKDLDLTIQSLSDSVIGEYQSCIHLPYLKQMYDKKMGYKSKLVIVAICFMFVIAISVVMLLKLYHRKYRAIQRISAGVLGGGVFGLVASQFIVGWFHIEHIQIPYYQDFILYYSRESVRQFYYIDLVVLLIAFSLFLWGWHMKYGHRAER